MFSTMINKDINQLIFDSLTLTDKYNFYLYCQQNNLTEELQYIEKYFESLHYEPTNTWINLLIDNENEIPEILLHRYKDNIDWHIASIYQTFSDEFIFNHREYIMWRPLGMHQKLTKNNLIIEFFPLIHLHVISFLTEGILAYCVT